MITNVRIGQPKHKCCLKQNGTLILQSSLIIKMYIHIVFVNAHVIVTSNLGMRNIRTVPWRRQDLGAEELRSHKNERDGHKSHNKPYAMRI